MSKHITIGQFVGGGAVVDTYSKTILYLLYLQRVESFISGGLITWNKLFGGEFEFEFPSSRVDFTFLRRVRWNNTMRVIRISGRLLNVSNA